MKTKIPIKKKKKHKTKKKETLIDKMIRNYDFESNWSRLMLR